MKVVIFDTETDGLIANSAIPLFKQPRCVELFAITLEQAGEGPAAVFSEVSVYEQMFNTGRALPEVITGITGITPEMMADKPPFSAHSDEVLNLIQGADRVVAHNLSYDKSIINFEMDRAGLGRPLKWPETICTVEATEYFFGFRLNLKLLHKTLFDEEFADAHRAENDVRALVRVYQELVRRNVL